MTAPLPTPDDLIALLSESVTWHTPTPEGQRATISPQWVERMAEAIFARLRPAFERLAAVTPTDKPEWEWQNVNQVMELVKQEGDANCERAFHFLLGEVNTLRASLARKDEALRARGEALRKLSRRHKDLCSGGEECRLHDEADAALARAQEEAK